MKICPIASRECSPTRSRRIRNCHRAIRRAQPAFAGVWRDVSSGGRTDGGGASRCTSGSSGWWSAPRRRMGRLSIWDVGLGRGGQCGRGAGSICGRQARRGSRLHSFDQTTAPLAFALEHADELGYLAPHARGHRAACSPAASGHGDARVEAFIAGDFREHDARLAAGAARDSLRSLFARDESRNCGRWSISALSRLSRSRAPVFAHAITRRSTAVRVTLLLAGFFVGRGHATGEKDETTIASNALHAARRTARSRAGWNACAVPRAPRRCASAASPGRISARRSGAHWRAHPQFCGRGV